MNCTESRDRVFPWIDGELDPDEERSFREHIETCEECRLRGAAEASFERRIAGALVEELPRARLQEMLSRARISAAPASPAPATPAARVATVFRFPRLWGSMAASIALFVGAAWLLCVPPFECPYLQAVETAAVSPATLPGSSPGGNTSLRSRIQPPPALGGLPQTGAPEATTVRVDGPWMKATLGAVRARYGSGDSEVVVVWSDGMGQEPSFRRRVERDGDTMWVAYEDSRTLVAFLSGDSGVLCTVVSTRPEEDLLSLACELRAATR